MKVNMLVPLCGPKHNVASGKVAEVDKKLGDELIKQGAATPYIDPKQAQKNNTAAKQTAMEAIDKALDGDIAAIKTKLAADSVKPGAKKADLEALADEAIGELRSKANEAKASL